VSGRAEFFNGMEWGTICDDFFNATTAQIFCQSIDAYLGFHHFTNTGSLPLSHQ
jgi:hypothetical protein